MNYYSHFELRRFGFKSLGENVKIFKKADILTPELLSIGDNVQIDDGCIISGSLDIGHHVHIAIGTTIFGGGSLKIGNYSNISARTVIITGTDDFSGDYLMGPTVPTEKRNITRYSMTIGNHVIIGAHCTINPGVCLADGTCIGSHSLVTKSVCNEWGVYVGCPAKFLKTRLNGALSLE